jgi:hypothetical protein
MQYVILVNSARYGFHVGLPKRLPAKVMHRCDVNGLLIGTGLTLTPDKAEAVARVID